MSSMQIFGKDKNTPKKIKKEKILDYILFL